MQSTLVRIHKNDHVLMKQNLKRDGLALQHFMTACVEAYLRREPDVLRLLKDWRDANVIKKGDESKFDFSDRERRAILDELDAEFDDTKED